MDHSQCEFFRYFTDGRSPQIADRFAGGFLSMRAAQYCDAVTLASGFGWWLYCPVDCTVVWDGQSIIWSLDGENFRAVDDTAHFPGFPDRWNETAPDDLADLCPAFLTALPEPGLLQVSLGLFARTAPGWMLALRRPANFPLPGPIEHFDGIVDTSAWMGPLFINLRLTKTDVPIRLRADMPLVQAQPLPLTLLASGPWPPVNLEPGPAEWDAYHRSVAEPYSRPTRAFGAYATDERRRRKASGCPVAVVDQPPGN